MKNLALLICICIIGLFHSSQVFASGCSFYGTILQIHESQTIDILKSEHYEILSSDENEYTIVLQSNPSQIYTLTKTSSSRPVNNGDEFKVELTLKDVIFEEGDGCGPIYICETGYITLKTEDSTFTYPKLKEKDPRMDYLNYDDSNFTYPNLVPVFGNSRIESDSSYKQCKYGNW
jgi:hypothetical protein